MLTTLGSPRLFVSALSLVLTLLLLAPTAPVEAEPEAHAASVSIRHGQRAADLRDRIAALPIVKSVVEKPGLAAGGTRFFRIKVRLPVDHNDPDGPTFPLRLTLTHVATSRPMVVQTSGYGLWTWDISYLGEVAELVDGNQIDVEHRFFKPSRPSDPDWAAQLTIEQSAADLHQIITAFQEIYRKPWISTGASKGGMTMTYHRRFYPSDVAGTVAYVAPNDAVETEDSAYDDFMDTVGGDAYASCRSRIVALQRRVLDSPKYFKDRLSKYLSKRDQSVGTYLNLRQTLEVTVIETYFAFWQYQDAKFSCGDVPRREASRARVFRWIGRTTGWGAFSTDGITPFVPYYYQAATQLGSPQPYEKKLAGRLRYPGLDIAATFVPADLKPLTFDPGAMADIDEWVRTEASRMIFLYGEFDPWSAEAFACGAGGAARDCVRRTVRQGNHGASIVYLEARQRRQLMGMIRDWAGLDTARAALPEIERRGVDGARAGLRARLAEGTRR